MKRIYGSIFAVVLLAAFCLSNKAVAHEKAQGVSSNETKFFPLKVGNYWLYQGIRRWARPGSDKIREQPVSWKMEVTEVIGRDFITAAVIKGHPQDAATSEDTRGDYLILAIGEDRYYFLQGIRVAEVASRLRNKKDLLVNLVYDDELFLKAPQINNPEEVFQTQDPEQTNSWIVAEENDVSPEDVTGGSDPKFRKKFRLVFKAIPNHTSIDFVPGIGITHYRYHHDGLVAEADLKLIEYFAG